MLTRILVLASLVFVLVVPTALAASGAPQPPAQGNGTSPAAARLGGRGGKLEQRLADLRQKLDHAGATFEKRCVSGKADADKCAAAAKKLLAALERVDGRLDSAISTIEQRCAAGSSQQTGTTPAQAPSACAHAQQVIQLLQAVQSKIREFEQKLQDWPRDQPTSDANGSGAATTSAASTSPDLESLDQLSGDLAAARNAAAQSGL
jgi:hypothetical protein